MDKKYVLFDFDGTVSDSSEGIINSVIYALSKYGIKEENKEVLYRFIGPPLYDSFREFYGFSNVQALEAVEFYRERYHTLGMYESRIYDGIRELVSKLRLMGAIVGIATSKPEETVKKMMNFHKITDCFDFIAGSTYDISRRTKSDVIGYAIKRFGIDTSRAVMVGDTRFDIEGAKAFSMTSIGVTFGFGSEAELKAAGADFIAHSASDAEKILLDICSSDN